MGEKYCQEFCHALTLDHEAVNSDSEQTFRKVTCFDKCSQSFARCHTTEKCMKNEWFNAEEIDDGVQDVEGKIKVDEVAAYNAGTCDPKIHYYKNCSLHSTDTDYWSVNFIDLLRLCNTRSKRIHYNNVFRNPSIKSKCNNLNFVGEDGKCLFTPTDASATETFKNCNSWDAPNCDKSTGYCSNTEETLNIEADYSMKTAWNNDADLEFCFPPKPHDQTSPTEAFVAECRQRFLLSNRNWPQEEWTMKKIDLHWKTSKVQDWFGMISTHTYDSPQRNWNVHSDPEHGDLYLREFECTMSDKCWTSPNNGETLFRNEREFVALGCTLVNDGNGFDDAPTLEEYTQSQEACRGDDSDKVFDEQDYKHFAWPSHTQEQMGKVPSP